MAAAAQLSPELQHALAIAYVRAKREREADHLLVQQKAQRLEQRVAVLQEQQQQLQLWVQQAVNGSSSSSQHPAPADLEAGPGAAWLPPLDAHVPSVAAPQRLQPAADNSKAQLLSSMLLTNMRMLRLLKPAPSSSAPDAGCVLQQEPAQQAAALAVPFVRDTLLRAPASSLRTTYMQRTAALLAAALTLQQQQQQQLGDPAEHGGFAAREAVKERDLQDMALAAAQVQLCLQDLLALCCPAAAAATTRSLSTSSEAPAPAPAATAGGCAASCTTAAAAAAAEMLSCLSQQAASGALCLAATWRLLEGCCQGVADGACAAASASLGYPHSLGRAKGACQAAAAALADVPPLLALQESIMLQLPRWARDLEASPAGLAALRDAVRYACSVHGLCQQGHLTFSLAVSDIVHSTAQLATALQQLAVGLDQQQQQQPGGATANDLRKACAKLCMTLRDAFIGSDV